MNSPLLWTGSKRKLAKRIIAKFPATYDTYFELFAGGANVLFALEPKHAVLNDVNQELMNFYQVLKDNPVELERQIRNTPWNKETFYIVRNQKRISKMKQAARFYYLNWSCFQGTHERCNAKGEFNGGWGFFDKNNFPKEKHFKFERIQLANKVLQNVELYNQSYETFLSTIKLNDIVYLDPPYKVNENCGQHSYTPICFSDKQHYELVVFCKQIHAKGAKFVLSNSYSDETVEMYKDFNIEINEVRRNCTVRSRPLKKEILVDNIIN